jgi:hypothetical protein
VYVAWQNIPDGTSEPKGQQGCRQVEERQRARETGRQTEVWEVGSNNSHFLSDILLNPSRTRSLARSIRAAVATLVKRGYWGGGGGGPGSWFHTTAWGAPDLSFTTAGVEGTIGSKSDVGCRACRTYDGQPLPQRIQLQCVQPNATDDKHATGNSSCSTFRLQHTRVGGRVHAKCAVLNLRLTIEISSPTCNSTSKFIRVQTTGCIATVLWAAVSSV